MEDVNRTQCLRCTGKMQRIGIREIQLGRVGFFLGTLPNLISGSLVVEIQACSECGKLEFYTPDELESDKPPQEFTKVDISY